MASWVALVTRDVRHGAVLLLLLLLFAQFLLCLVELVDLCQLLSGTSAVLHVVGVLIVVLVQGAALLGDALLLDGLVLHRVDKALDRVELGRCLRVIKTFIFARLRIYLRVGCLINLLANHSGGNRSRI